MITWTIVDLPRDTTTGFVLSVDWKATITGEGKEFSIEDRCNFVYDGEIPIAYESLTEDVVWQWVFARVDKEQIEQKLQDTLAKLPSSGLPW